MSSLINSFWAAVGGVEGWNISTSVFNQNLDVSTNVPSVSGVTFKPDGTKMYLTGFTFERVNEYDLSTAWDISSASFFQFFSVLTQDNNVRDIAFKPDGSKMYITGTGSAKVHEYDLSTDWDISSATINQNFDVSGKETGPQSVEFKPDGSKMYITGFLGSVHEYDLSTDWDISTSVFNQSFSVSINVSFPTGVTFKTDGTKMFVLNASGEIVNDYDLSVAWDISTSVFNQNFDVSANATSSQGITFKTDGTKMYIVASTSDTVSEWDLTS